ncbi:ndufs4 NADH dehydrogenase Fe-S protein subunit [Tieghemiomyces parasiticus]|uniref:NADH dehydrogenase [ubiquinone] iron-sulfur protein 4, mitochondrial n=1 Tax=Tieghemiomyces parasiticus TaxID=78921 RepID=A0A9W8AGN7_9FUNG|nr:ndufs4 NADH dehydrogenase Fe-S protein subunit [Tieghemiomyces parasiticus]
MTFSLFSTSLRLTAAPLRARLATTPALPALRTLTTSPFVFKTPETSATAASNAAGIIDSTDPKAVVDPTRTPGGLVPADLTSSAPVELHDRMVRIYMPPKSAMQSGKHATRSWRLDFDIIEHGDRWENPLMGWASSADYMQALRMKFKTKEAAIEFAEKQGWSYYVQAPKERKFKPMVYADNFTYSPGKLRLVRTK